MLTNSTNLVQEIQMLNFIEKNFWKNDTFTKLTLRKTNNWFKVNLSGFILTKNR